MDAPSSTPVSEWIAAIKQGDADAQTRLWERYYFQLVARAHKKLAFAKGRKDFEGEDVVQHVFHSLFLRAEQGRFPKLNDRRDLARLLIVMTENRLKSKLRDCNARKRGGGIQHTAIHLLGPVSDPQLALPPIEEGAEDEFIQSVQEVLSGCDELTRAIAMLRMEGYEISDIAQSVGVSRSSVNRKIRYLKDRLEEMGISRGTR
ncbi:MAG: ECF-type sigma factor [Planctomycetota bacterium]